MSTINLTQLLELLKAHPGKIFSVTFTKKDGTDREMTCREGVKRYLKGGVLPYNPDDFGLLCVFDIQKSDYRMINLNTLKRIKIGGTEYVFEATKNGNDKQ